MAAIKSYSKAFSYTRLSKEDRDRLERLKRENKADGYSLESNSIANQKKLIRDYISKQDDIILVREYEDDGYTGTNFDRPGFIKMMEAIEQGEADCIIVKDLSRFGRDYIDAGKYIQKFFPLQGIRFIAINDNIDTNRNDQTDDLIIPFKNLINDSYCRDLSIKLRGQFRVQRTRGEYVGAYVAYGYIKDKDDKHKLVIDEFASDIVRQIFAWKMGGYSQRVIAERLNQMTVPAPADYKRQMGINYKSGFQVSSQSKWGAVTVTKILKNKIYIGVLEQGKRSSPNYKVKKMMEKEEAEWIVIEDNHEPIIDKETFFAVQQSLERDTRISEKGTVYPLSGFLFCGTCQAQMCRRSVSRGYRKFHYYICGTYKKGDGCTSHSYSVNELEKKILKAINVQISLVVDLKKIADELGEGKLKIHKMKKYELLIANKEKEIDENREYRLKLYESMVDGMINHDEYVQLRQRYTYRIEEAELAVFQLKADLENVSAGLGNNGTWMDSFLKYHEITELSRDIVITLIDKIYIYEDKRIDIQFNFRNEFEGLKDFIMSIHQEAV